VYRRCKGFQCPYSSPINAGLAQLWQAADIRVSTIWVVFHGWRFQIGRREWSRKPQGFQVCLTTELKRWNSCIRRVLRRCRHRIVYLGVLRWVYSSRPASRRCEGLEIVQIADLIEENILLRCYEETDSYRLLFVFFLVFFFFF
jgi:hypothetical protein